MKRSGILKGKNILCMECGLMFDMRKKECLWYAKNGFKNYEKIFRICLLSKPFTVGDELTNTLKVKRDVVNKKYRSEIAKLFK